MSIKDGDSLTLGIVGAGAMGTGIAHVAALGGIHVKLFDTRAESAQKACGSIAERLIKRIDQQKMPAAEGQAAIARLTVVRDLADLADCDVVIEAIIESLDAKRSLFAQLEALVKTSTILASNTSSIPIGAIAAHLTHRERVAGLHFFNPVPLMRLVEVIPGPDTAAEVISRLLSIGKRMGRTPVVVKDSPGFLVNYGGRAYPTESLAILQESVATASEIDAIMRDCYGFRMGPFQLMDLTGIDVNFPVTQLVHESFFSEPRLRSTPLHRYLFETNQLGRKTGRGFFNYESEPFAVSPDSVATAEPIGTVWLHTQNDPLANIVLESGANMLASDDHASPIFITPIGEDCTSYSVRHGLDYRRVIALDMLGQTDTRLTLMAAPGVDKALLDCSVALLSRTRKVTVIGDSPGFVGQRIVAMIVNLGCEMAQTGIASIADIDCAMRLGLNYPEGPLEMADSLGVATVHEILEWAQRLTGDDRYRPSQWLRRRATLGLSARVH